MANDEWYYARGNQQQGPVSLQAVQEMVRSGQIQPNDLADDLGDFRSKGRLRAAF